MMHALHRSVPLSQSTSEAHDCPKYSSIASTDTTQQKVMYTRYGIACAVQQKQMVAIMQQWRKNTQRLSCYTHCLRKDSHGCATC